LESKRKSTIAGKGEGGGRGDSNFGNSVTRHRFIGGGRQCNLTNVNARP